jgi:hypothetical protein
MKIIKENIKKVSLTEGIKNSWNSGKGKSDFAIDISKFNLDPEVEDELYNIGGIDSLNDLSPKEEKFIRKLIDYGILFDPHLTKNEEFWEVYIEAIEVGGYSGEDLSLESTGTGVAFPFIYGGPDLRVTKDYIIFSGDKVTISEYDYDFEYDPEYADEDDIEWFNLNDVDGFIDYGIDIGAF